MPLLGNAEKGELEVLILQRFTEHFDRHGAEALLAPGLRLVVNASGAALDSGETPDPLAAVEVRSLFTAVCYMSGGTLALPREALGSLAAEASNAAAQQINRIGAG